MTEVTAPNTHERHLPERAADEFKRFLSIFLYLWVVFALLSIHKSIVLSEHHLNLPEHAFAIINSLVFAKVLLFGEDFHLGTRFHDKPLIYPILHKCLIFTIVLICFDIVESILVGGWHGSTVANSLPPRGDRSLKSILSVGILCFVILVPFFSFREIGRVIGRRELWSLILRNRRNDPMLSSLERL
jgi:hypothetical protein